MKRSIRNVKNIPPEYINDFPIVSLNLLDLNDVHPFFLTDLQMPKQVSIKMANRATNTIGLTGAMTVSRDVDKIRMVFFIR